MTKELVKGCWPKYLQLWRDSWAYQPKCCHSIGSSQEGKYNYTCTALKLSDLTLWFKRTFANAYVGRHWLTYETCTFVILLVPEVNAGVWRGCMLSTGKHAHERWTRFCLYNIAREQRSTQPFWHFKPFHLASLGREASQVADASQNDTHFTSISSCFQLSEDLTSKSDHGSACAKQPSISFAIRSISL